MEYSEYHEKELAIRQTMNELQERYQAEMLAAKQELSNLTDEYLGNFAVGKAIKYKSNKYFVEKDYQLILDNRTAVTIRKAKKDGSPSINGTVHYYINTTELEVWNEL